MNTPKVLTEEELAKLKRILKTAQRGDYLDNTFDWSDVEGMLATK